MLTSMKLKNQQNDLYCSAIVQATEGTSYRTLWEELKGLEQKTQLEEGCLMFVVVPLSQEVNHFALWEVWESKTAFYAHHQKDYTKELFKKRLHDVVVFESSEEVTL